MSRHARVYTEMVVTGALLHGDRARFLRFSEAEHPIALQLGGSDPAELADCAKIAEDWGYDEVNLNCGCPSDRVQRGKIGAVLMREPALVADCIDAMQRACTIPVTVKQRIGVDELDDYEHMRYFVETVAQTGCKVFIVHARKAWLKGLSPKENREIPPLRYEWVEALKQEFPHLTIVINGGITDLEQAQTLLTHLDGVMVGREAYSNPYMLASVDQSLFGEDTPVRSRDEILNAFVDYCRDEIAQGQRLHHMSRHVLGLFHGQAGGRLFRRYLSEHGVKSTARAETLLEAAAQRRL